MKAKALLQLSLALSAFGLLQSAGNCPAGSARNANYEVTEDTMVFTNPGRWFYGVLDNKLYIRGVEMTAEDHATDERLTGTVTIVFDMVWEGPKQLGPIWGYVKLQNHHAEPAKNGWWEGYCFGARELDQDGETVVSSFEGTMQGRGIHEGLIARYWYKGTDVMGTGILPGHGYVVEHGAPVRPLKTRTSHTHLGMIVPGFYVIPFSPVPITDPIEMKTLIYWWVEDASGLTTHMGLGVDSGFGIFDMETGTGSGMGYETAANGDKIHWVAGLTGLPNEYTRLDLNFAGGTARFDAAVGGFTATFKEEVSIPDPENPMLLQVDFGYAASGWIRY